MRLPGGAEADAVAVEEPLEIRIGGEPVAVTMRTPGPRRGARARLLPHRGYPRDGRGCPPTWRRTRSRSRRRRSTGAASQRSFYTSSSCGVCGKGALEAVAVEAPRVESELARARRRWSRRCPDRLRDGAADVRRDRRAPRDRPLRRRRRAALRARGRRPPQRDGQGDRLGVRRRPAAARRRVLCVSGRLSFELVQKAAVAGCPMLVARRRAVEPRGRARRATAA